MISTYSFTPNLPSVRTEIFFGENILFSDEMLQQVRPYHKKVIITDPGIKTLYGEKLAKHIGAHLLTLSSHEKTEASQQEILQKLFTLQCGKDTALLALGGGLITDLVGFIASIYLRSVPLILIPTSLLAMVDASIGGKTGIDTPFGKNSLGSLYYPKAIIADISLLKSLPSKQWINGMAEIRKIGLTHDASIWEEAIAQEKPSAALIFKAMQAKLSIVTKDPQDEGIRKTLNFGHTIGHALETISDYTLDHGQAVSIGCAVESFLSMSLNLLSLEDFARIHPQYTSFSLPKNYTRSAFLEALAYDKKRQKGTLFFVLLEQIGRAILRPVTQEELMPSIQWMEKTYV